MSALATARTRRGRGPVAALAVAVAALAACGPAAPASPPPVTVATAPQAVPPQAAAGPGATRPTPASLPAAATPRPVPTPATSLPVTRPVPAPASPRAAARPPGAVAPAAPGVVAPAAPGVVAPAAAGVVAPAAPGVVAPAAPGVVAPAAPGVVAPAAAAATFRARLVIGTAPPWESWTEVELTGAAPDALRLCRAFVELELGRRYPGTTGLQSRVSRSCATTALPAMSGPAGPPRRGSFLLVQRREVGLAELVVADLMAPRSPAGTAGPKGSTPRPGDGQVGPHGPTPRPSDGQAGPRGPTPRPSDGQAGPRGPMPRPSDGQAGPRGPMPRPRGVKDITGWSTQVSRHLSRASCQRARRRLLRIRTRDTREAHKNAQQWLRQQLRTQEAEVARRCAAARPRTNRAVVEKQLIADLKATCSRDDAPGCARARQRLMDYSVAQLAEVRSQRSCFQARTMADLLRQRLKQPPPAPTTPAPICVREAQSERP